MVVRLVLTIQRVQENIDLNVKTLLGFSIEFMYVSKLIYKTHILLRSAWGRSNIKFRLFIKFTSRPGFFYIGIKNIFPFAVFIIFLILIRPAFIQWCLLRLKNFLSLISFYFCGNQVNERNFYYAAINITCKSQQVSKAKEKKKKLIINFRETFPKGVFFLYI